MKSNKLIARWCGGGDTKKSILPPKEMYYVIAVEHNKHIIWIEVMHYLQRRK